MNHSVDKSTEGIFSDDHDADDMAFMETGVASGRGKGVVVELEVGTEIGKIAEMIQEESTYATTTEDSQSGKDAGIVGPGSLFIGICTGLPAGNPLGG